MAKFLIVITILLVTSSFGAIAQQPAAPSPLTFQAWKEQQILDAQNQTLRISARIAQLKAGKNVAGKADSAATVSNTKVKRAELDPVSAAERDLRRAQESLQSAGTLTLQDYVLVYLPTLQDQAEALQILAGKLTKEELAEIFKTLVMSRSSGVDAKRNSGILSEALPPPTKAKTL